MSKQTLGIYGPLPGDRSGVATYIADSLTSLAAYYEPVRAEPGTDPDQFDRVLYHLGNNAMHEAAFGALATRPGPVILHEYNNLDYYLSSWDRLSNGEQDRFLVLAGRYLGRRFRDRAELDYYLDAHSELDRYSMDMGVESIAIEQATQVLVHSPEARLVLARRYPKARIQHIPFGVHPITPPDRTELFAAWGLPADAFVFATFGFLGAYKRIGPLLQAWRQWHDRPADAVLLLAGEARDGLDVPDDPTIVHTGYLPDPDFDQLLVSVDCAIQLRGPWLGESSGPLTKLLAHRRPVITSEITGLRLLADTHDVTYVPVGNSEVDGLTDALRARYGLRPPVPRFDAGYDWNIWAAAVCTATSQAAPV
ncbi:hypothetical protein [Streptomyces sp. NPDC006510]|uniref:hypothetical protein n=1 Tax=Streptomyces sp. NPDC006510 TaxID=3155600 RepID=UPI00339EAF8C